MPRNKKIWFNYWQPEYKEKTPSFYSVQNFNWARKIEEKWPIIQQELQALIDLKENEFQIYFGSDRDTGSTGWKTITLKTWGINVNDNLNRCPELKKQIEQTPGWTSAAISLLEPNTSIKSHQGDTNAILRAHLGINIPGTKDICALKVNEEVNGWEEGKLVIFLDAHWHEAWNNSDKKRLVLILDIIQDEFLPLKEEVCIRVRGFLLLQILGIRLPFLMRLPKWIHAIVFMKLCFILQWIYPFQKKKGVFIKHN